MNRMVDSDLEITGLELGMLLAERCTGEKEKQFSKVEIWLG